MRTGLAISLAGVVLGGAATLSAATAYSPVAVPRTETKKMYVHVMPWFETKTSSGTGAWGIHWTMANRNPDVVDANGKRQIASNYYPQIGPYASGDKDVVEYQLLLMKYAGVDGVLIDWPGSQNVWDYPKNRQNAEAMIAQTAKLGLTFAVVYEDHNIGMAFDAGLIANKITAGQQDLTYVKNNYFTKSNYIQQNGAPLLLDFGPQTFVTEADWTTLFSVLPTKPTFLTLWYQIGQAGTNGKGEYAWIYSDGMAGLDNFYNNHPLGIKYAVGYPGFNTFYTAGGWAGPTWTLPYGATLATTLDKAKAASVNAVQIATWNDYGEGTMIEPTLELGYGPLTTMQQKWGVSSSQGDLQLIDTLYRQRKQYAGNAAKQDQLDQAMYDLASYQVASAAAILNGVPTPTAVPTRTATATATRTSTATATTGARATATATSTATATARPTATATTNGVVSYSIKNVWKGTYLYETAGKVAYGATVADNSYKWVLEDKNGFKRIKNLATGNYMNIEHLYAYVESGAVPDTYYSGYWTLETAGTDTRLKNAWQGTYLNVEGQTGYAQCTAVPDTFYSSRWTLVVN